MKQDNTVRLQAYLARSGVASRRASETLIEEGKVRVNGEVAGIGASVDPAQDLVEVDGRVITPQRLQWIALHKPKGYVTTRDDPEGRKTVYDLLPDHLRHLFHVGRLDRDSSGLLLLTNDGTAANRLLHPRYGTTKEYWVDVDGDPSADDLRTLVRGVDLEDGPASAQGVAYRDTLKSGTTRLVVVMREGRQREVRRMFEAIGFPVRRLFRQRFGPVEIERLAPGKWRFLTADEIEALGSDAGPPRPTGRGPGPRAGRGGRGDARGGRAAARPRRGAAPARGEGPAVAGRGESKRRSAPADSGGRASGEERGPARNRGPASGRGGPGRGPARGDAGGWGDEGRGGPRSGGPGEGGGRRGGGGSERPAEGGEGRGRRGGGGGGAGGAHAPRGRPARRRVR